MGFGHYIRDERVKSKKSLREVAEALGVTHVYLGQVERGVRRVLPEAYWPALMRVVPSITRDRLLDEAERSKKVEIDMVGASREQQDFTLEFARRMASSDLDQAKMRKLLKVLYGEDRR